MKAFVTGGTGFIGSHLIQKLVARGDQVTALVRSKKGAAELLAMGAHPVWGDINAIESMREGMRGNDVVFHLAAWYKLGARDCKKAEFINVDGTRNVLRLAEELGIPRIIYTSTVAVYGDTHGTCADETYSPPEGPFLTEYDRTKWLAHFRVAIPLIEKGVPIIIVMPGGVYGPGDTSMIGEMMRYFNMGFFPVVPAAETAITYAHVEDIAEGHILAADKGTIGETYHLTGPAISLGEMMKIWSQVSGKHAPWFSLPSRFVKPFLPLVSFFNSIFALPPLFSRDSIVVLGATYLAHSEKARSQLGWQTRPVMEGMQETFDWLQQNTPPLQFASTPAQRKQLAGIAIFSAFAVFTAWLFLRRRR